MDFFFGKNGNYKENYVNGNPQSEYNFKQDKYHGICKSWFENRVLNFELNFKNGLKHGICKNWFENGNPKLEENYIDGKLDGISKIWYENGNLQSKVNYINGKLNGICKSWYENGNLQSEFNYINGHKHGICINWYPNINITTEFYEFDVLQYTIIDPPIDNVIQIDNVIPNIPNIPIPIIKGKIRIMNDFVKKYFLLGFKNDTDTATDTKNEKTDTKNEKTDTKNENTMCFMCLEDYSKNDFETKFDSLVVTECGHICCKGCFDGVINNGISKCPICNKIYT